MRSQDICGTQRESQTMHNLRFVYYFNPSSAVACFIRNSKGELLLVRRAKEPAKGTLDLPGALSICMNQPKMQPTGKWKRKRDLTSPAAVISFPFPIFIPIPASRYIRSICSSNVWPNPSTEQKLKTMQRDHYSASQPVESGRFRIAIYQKSSRPLYKVIYFLYLQLRTNIYRYIYIYLYYKS